MGKRWMEKIGSFKKEQILILVLAGALLLVIAIPTETPEEETIQSEPVVEAAAADSRAKELESRLQQILEQVEGVGKTKVMLTLKSEGRKIVEKDLEQAQGKEESGQGESGVLSEESSNSEATVYEKDSRGNETPYVTEELEPEIAGVLVIAQGAGDSAVVCGITEAVMALFGIEAHKIKVMKME